jgi:hypothetical protein
MAIESVSNRDQSIDPSVCDPTTSTCGPPPEPNVSTLPLAPLDPGATVLVDKFKSIPPIPMPDLSGCGTNQDCANADGRPVREGQNKSEELPNFSLTARRFAPAHTFGGGFHGDAESRNIPAGKEGGGFTTDPSATARVMMRVGVDEGQPTMTLGRADISRHPIFGEGLASITKKSNSGSTGSTEGMIDAKASGSNPLLPIVSPDNDSEMQVAYELLPGKLHLDGSLWGDRFPNGELMITDRAGSTLMLGEFESEGSVYDLFGNSARVPKLELLNFSAEIPLDPSGNFAGSPNVRSK